MQSYAYETISGSYIKLIDILLHIDISIFVWRNKSIFFIIDFNATNIEINNNSKFLIKFDIKLED